MSAQELDTHRPKKSKKQFQDTVLQLLQQQQEAINKIQKNMVKKKCTDVKGITVNPHRGHRWPWFGRLINIRLRSVLSEFLGTMLFVYLATGSILSATYQDGQLTTAGIVLISFGIGISLSTAIYATTKISGGHLNPAVSFAFMITGKMPVILGLCYVAAQIAGAIVGSALVKATVPKQAFNQVSGGVTHLGPGESVVCGLFLEFFITWLFVWTIFATCKIPSDKSDMGPLAPLAVGYAVSVGNFFAVPFTGASMNPARTLGPAVVANFWSAHWIYWVGPLAGSAVGALSYVHFLSKLDIFKPRVPIFKKSMTA